MHQFEKILGSLSRPRSILISLALYLVFVLAVFPMLTDETSTAQPIDLAFHYSVEEVYGWIESYGEENRKAYMITELSVDLVYPIVYTCLFCGLIGFLLRFEHGGPCKWIAALPVSIWFFDLLENAGIVTMLYNYPEELKLIARLTAWATSLKWSLAAIVILLTLLLGLRFLVGKPGSSPGARS